MKLFNCPNCKNQIFFENTQCINCGSAVGFDPLSLEIKSPSATDNLRYCDNFQKDACNWLVPVNDSQVLCTSCELNHIIPNLNKPENLGYWQDIEIAKRRLIYSLLKLKLPVSPKAGEDQPGIWFDFLEDQGDKVVMTGHNHGLITLNIDEADSVAREANRNQMEEPYRTLLGHFRHEIGHYYWDVLISGNSAYLEKFREIFGDETYDYSQALKEHYEKSDFQSWRNSFVSHYASSHPWEDWAETWAHYLHILAVLETSHYFNLVLRSSLEENRLDYSSLKPFSEESIETIINHWIPMATVLNSLNRSMGHPDFYPFILNPPVIEKLGFIHKTIRHS